MLRPKSAWGAMLGAGLLALVVGATPALGHTVLEATGTRGAWSLRDTHRRPGVTCEYSIYADLATLHVRAPTVYGSHASLTWVGWKFKVLRSRNMGATWRLIYTSAAQKDKASTSAAADGFSNRTWEPMEVDPPADAWYKVQEIILFYAPGSSTTVEGRAVTEIDNYKETYPTAGAFVQPDYCEALWGGG